MTISPAARQRIIDLKIAGETNIAIASIVDVSSSSVGTILKAAAREGALGYQPVLPGFHITQTNEQTNADGSLRRRSVQQRPAPGPQFQLPKGMRIKELSTLTDGEHNTKLIWHKAKEVEEDPVAVTEEVMKALEGWKPAAPMVARPERVRGKLLTNYLIGDHHLGMLAWAKQCGASYDLKIAEEVLRDATDELVQAAPASKYAVILNMGDFFHADGFKPLTPEGGNFLDRDGRQEKVLDVGIRLQCHCVDRALTKHDEVELVELPGNHDPLMTSALRAIMAAWYRNEPRVKISDDRTGSWFRKHGRVMQAAHHGDKIKPSQMPMYCATAQPQMWGETQYRVAFTAHIHHKEKIAAESTGMFVESMSTLAGKDQWAASHGYHSWRSMSCVSFDETAEFTRHTASVNENGWVQKLPLTS